MSSTRERIVDAAEALITEDPDTRPSVRTVAARAGIGASTLRHYFPSQRALMDEVVSRALGRQYSDEALHDPSIPAHRRLLTCAENLLEPIGYGAGARDLWRQAFVTTESARTETSPAPSLTATAVSRITTQLERRVTGWFEVLADEGVVAKESVGRRARLLLAVVDGLSISRAFPGASTAQSEREVLTDAIRATLALPEADAVPSRGESSTATSTDRTDGETA
jgi:AcrR family transcriptional regulator